MFEDEEREVQEVESLCMRCHEQVSKTLSPLRQRNPTALTTREGGREREMTKQAKLTSFLWIAGNHSTSFDFDPFLPRGRRDELQV